ncbi:hypothetical protein ACWC98_35795 [Streptomyces goshikiensis]
MPAAGCLGLAGPASLLTLQFWSARYQPWLYGSAIVTVSAVGTLAADVVHAIAWIPPAARCLVRGPDGRPRHERRFGWGPARSASLCWSRSPRSLCSSGASG